MITCIVTDSSGKEIGTFQPKGEKNFVDEAADQGVELPFSCHAGACMTCACKIKTGAEMIDPEKDGPKYIDTEEGTQLACISGLKSEFADKDGVIEIEMLS